MSQRKLDLDGALADLATSLSSRPPPTWPPRSPPGWARPGRGTRGAFPGPAPWRWLERPGGWRRLAAAGLAVLLLAAAVLVVSPGTREAVARRLGLRGIGVELGGPPPPTVTTTPGGRTNPGVGERVTLEAAAGSTSPCWSRPPPGSSGRTPCSSTRPCPPAVGSTSSTGPPAYPPSSFTDAGLLITEFRGQPTPSSSRR